MRAGSSLQGSRGPGTCGGTSSAPSRARRPRLTLVPLPVERPRPGCRAGAAPARCAGARRAPGAAGRQPATLAAGEAPAVAAAIGRLGLPVYLSGMARGLLGAAHALQLRHRRREALREADCVLLAGVPADFRLDYGQHIRRAATLLSVNRDAHDLYRNRRPDVAVLGDPGALLQALAAQPLAGEAARAGWLAALRERDRQRDEGIAADALRTGQRVNPLHFFRELDAQLGDDAVLVADGGDFVATASYVLRPRSPLSWLDPGVFGTLGVGAGFALGAHCARPEARTWIVFGDGACGYSLAEFDTFVRHGIPVVAIVGNDAGWTQIAREQVKILGDDVGTVLARTRYHEVAAGFGALGIEIASAADVAAGLRAAREAAAAGRPVLLNVLLDATDFREGSISM
ncbi:MAG: thiamine pyrophosphate-dependent enzyme [Steroidobacteraceae bacterium]